MARGAVNPRVADMISPQGLPLKSCLAEDGKTWKAGEVGYLTSGTVTPVVNSGIVAAYCLFAETQATATSTSTVRIHRLIPGMKLWMFLMNAGTAAAWSAAYKGTRYGVRALSNVCYIDVATASGQFEIIDKASDLRDLEDGYLDMDAAPALVLAEFKFIS